MAEWTGLEPATPGVTGRYSNQLNYHSKHLRFKNKECLKALLLSQGKCLQKLVGANGVEPLTFAL